MASNASMYVNTIVFSVITGVISLGLLLLLLFVPALAHQYAYLVITVELGLLAVMVQAIVRIVLYEQDLRSAAQDAAKNAMVVDVCPDYWTASTTQTPSGPDVTCSNQYTAPNGQRQYQWLPGPAANAPKPPASIDLKDYQQLTMTAACPKVTALGAPWTDLTSKCAAFGVS
jgi:hypothetical protein